VARAPDRGHLLRVETASAERIAPICPHFGVCGGCARQHWQTARYRAWKRDLVADALRQAGVAAPVDDLIDAHGAGRRRIVLHARGATHDVLEVGFAARQAHRIVPIDRCPILAPGLAGIIEAAWALAETLRPAGKPLDLQAIATDAGIDVDIRGSGALDPQMSLDDRRIAEAIASPASRAMAVVAQRATPTVRMGRCTVALPPGAFLQATEEGEARSRDWCSPMPARPRRWPISLPASGRSRCGLRSAPGSSPRTPTRPPSARSTAQPPGRAGSSRSGRSGATCSAGP
jgi:23S rRNA (uracil1939-C5)-methyltransferase